MSPPADSSRLLSRLATLSDLARLRILRLLNGRELSVGELSRALQLPQSTVSRHLKLLHAGDWIVKRVEGTASLYALAEAQLDQDARTLWEVARAQMGRGPTLLEDDSRLAEVLVARERDSKSFFGEIGGAWDQLRDELFGHAFTTEALLGLIPRDWVVADLGCGTGNGAAVLAPHVERVIAIDREPAMLEAARKRLRNSRGVEFKQGDLSALPLDDGTIDAAMILLVLHHVEKPEVAVSEAHRVIRVGGTLMIVDMVAHDRDSYPRTMGHRHLGFDERTVKRWAKTTGFTSCHYRRLRPDTSTKGPGLFVATMLKG